MKKLITALLILALVLPAAALAADTDPIVGYWYIWFDATQYPEFKSSVGNYDHALSVYYFDKSGSIFLLENDVQDNTAEPFFMSTGKWEKDGSGYTYNLMAIGGGPAKIEDGFLWLTIQNGVLSMKLRKIEVFNPYGDYKY